MVPLTTAPIGAPAWQERVFPGLGRDVSGSYPPLEEMRNPGIGDVALQEMWRVARVSGVPYDGIKETMANAEDYAQAFDLAGAADARLVLFNYLNQSIQLLKAVSGVDHANHAINQMGNSAGMAKTLFGHRMIYTLWLRGLIVRGRNGSLPGWLESSAQQASIDFGRLQLMSQSAGMETWVGSLIASPGDYQRACIEVVSLQPAPVLESSVVRFFDHYMHDPIDPPDDDNAIQRLPNNARLFRERFIDNGDDMRKPTWKERLKSAGKEALETIGNQPSYPMMGIPF